MIDNYSIHYPFYGRLTSIQKSLYRQLLSDLQAAPAKIQFTTKCNSDDSFAAIGAIYYDHPEIFWITGGANLQTTNGVVTTFKPNYNPLSKNLNSNKKKFDQAVNSYLKGCTGKKVLEIERYIHDKMVLDIDYKHGSYDQSAYSALVDRKSVCAGYTRAFQYLMQKSGIPCYFCSGIAKGSATGNDWGPHAWNIIKLGEEYYNVDVTFNDCYGPGSDTISYVYYNCTDSAIAGNHKRNKEFAFLPKCTSTRLSFEKITGTSAELDRVYQDGVTCPTPVKDEKSFLNVVSGEIRKTNGREFTISFPAQGSSTAKNAMKWFQKAISMVYGDNIGYSIKGGTTDYRNGWYKITLSFKRQ